MVIYFRERLNMLSLIAICILVISVVSVIKYDRYEVGKIKEAMNEHQ